MTVEQVKQELRELRFICVLRKNKVQIEDTKGLQEKYTKAIENFDIVDKTIFVERIFKNTTYLKIGFMLNYSSEGVRARWRKKIVKELANMLEVKPTNFDKITESVESFAEWVLNNYYSVPEHIPCKSSCNKDCGECFKKWLQKECE